MRVLLTRPVAKLLETFNVWPPLGLGYLATALRKEHSVEILDCTHKKMNFEQFAEYIQTAKPDVVGFSVLTISFESTKRCASIVKGINPEIITIAGGPHPSGVPEETLRNATDLDFAFQGEADKGLPLLLRMLSSKESRNFSSVSGLVWRDNGKIIVNPPEFVEDLDKLGFPSWDLLNLPQYSNTPGIQWKDLPCVPISITRGCPYSCTFCCCGLITGKKIRRRSIENVIEEIKLLYHRYNVRMVMIVDDNFTLDRNFAKDFCLSLIKSGLNDLNWSVPEGLRIDKLDEELLKLMEESGCYYISVGIESSSQRILNLMKKELTVETVRSQVSLIRKVTKIKIVGLFIIGYPSETEEEIRETIRFARELDLDRTWFFFFSPALGTEIYKELKAKGRLRGLDWQKTWGNSLAFEPDYISGRRLKHLYRYAYLYNYTRPRMILRIIKEMGSFKFVKQMILGPRKILQWSRF